MPPRGSTINKYYFVMNKNVTFKTAGKRHKTFAKGVEIVRVPSNS